jgi:ATP-binding cassette, subfamily B, multidrug efflux pump
MKRLLKYVYPYWHLALFSTLLLMLISGLELFLPLLVKKVVDGPIANNDINKLIYLSLLYLALVVGGFILNYIQTYFLNLLGQKAMYDLRNEIFTKFQSLSFSYFDKNPVGRLITRITGDVDALNELFTQGVVAIFSDFMLLFGIIGILLYMNLKMALIIFTVFPPLIYVVNQFRTKARSGFRRTRVKLAKLNAYLQENITGMQVVQLFNRERNNYQRFKKQNWEYTEAFLSVVFCYAIFMPAIDILLAITFALIIWFGGSSYLSGIMTIGTLIAFIQYVRLFFRPLRDLSEKYNVLQDAMASSERIFILLDCDEIIPDLSNKKPDVVKIKGKVEFKSVFFAYKGDDYVLKDISFILEQGESVALVGATGAGKTTISNLLCRFYDVSKGKILIDDKDICEYPMEYLRKNISIILQDPFIFSGDIKRNICLLDSDIPMERIIQVAKHVNAHNFIEKLPNGYFEEVRERGSNLSLGQRQLIAFARALLYDPRILILDEATSSVDTDTEILIQEALRKILTFRTSIIIAHRLSTIKHVDRIIVLHKGRIVEEGTHENLIKLNGYYTRLYELQYKEQEFNFQGSISSS